jgi:hypothetical protein
MPLVFQRAQRIEPCFGCIVERSRLGSLVVVFVKNVKLSRNRMVRPGFCLCEQICAVFKQPRSF